MKIDVRLPLIKIVDDPLEDSIALSLSSQYYSK